MGKKKARFDKRKMRRLHYGPEWPTVNQPFEDEIKPILRALKNSQLKVSVRRSLENYLVIRLVSMIEYFFSNIVRRMVDERKLDVSKFFDEKSLEEKMKEGRTADQIAVSTFVYANYDQIQYSVSGLLDLDDFFGTGRALDKGDPYKYVIGAILLEKNFEEFKEMFDLRNDIVHGMKDANLSISNRKLSSLADNTMNVLDAASWICHPKFFEIDKELVNKVKR
jgi:hypothetical protein